MQVGGLVSTWLRGIVGSIPAPAIKGFGSGDVSERGYGQGRD